MGIIYDAVEKINYYFLNLIIILWSEGVFFVDEPGKLWYYDMNQKREEGRLC